MTEKATANSATEPCPPAYNPITFVTVHSIVMMITKQEIPFSIREDCVLELAQLMGIPCDSWHGEMWWSRTSRYNKYKSRCMIALAKTPYLMAFKFYDNITQGQIDEGIHLSPVGGKNRVDKVHNGMKALATTPLALLYQQ